MSNIESIIFANDGYITIQTDSGPPTKYPLMQVGSANSVVTQTYNGVKSLQIYTTCASTNSGTSYEPQFIQNILTGIGQVGGRFRVDMSTNVSLGSWANAFKASVNCNSVGGATGLLSVGIFEVTMPTTGIAGTTVGVEIEMTYGATCGALQKPAFFYLGTNGTARTDFDTYGDFLILSANLTAGTGKMVGAGTSTFRIGTGALGATKRYIPLSTAEASFTSVYPVVLTYAGTALTITSTITSADIVALISATSTATSGQSNGLVVTMTSTGNGKASSVCGNFYLVEQGNTDYVYPIYIGTAAISNKTIIQATGLFMYLDDMGNAVQHQAALSINRNITNVGTESDCFLEMRNHGGVSATAFIKLVGKAEFLWDASHGDLDDPISEGSDSADVSHKVAVKMADDSTRYLHLFAS